MFPDPSKPRRSLRLTDPPLLHSQKYQARGQGRYVGSAEDKKELKRARQDGKLGEAMLERRVKLKRCGGSLDQSRSVADLPSSSSDRYC